MYKEGASFVYIILETTLFHRDVLDVLRATSLTSQYQCRLFDRQIDWLERGISKEFFILNKLLKNQETNLQLFFPSIQDHIAKTLRDKEIKNR